MDKFVQFTESDPSCATGTNLFFRPGLVMDYFDGNTVTGLWNYAQNYAMSDNNYDTEFGPSTPGALNLVSGNTGASYAVSPTTGAKITTPISGTVSALNSNGLGTIYGDLDPAYDDCSNDSHAADENSYPLGVVTGQNIGNLLNARNITWGWFQGGFAPDRDQLRRPAGLRLRAREHRRRRRAATTCRTTTRSSTTRPPPTRRTCRRPRRRPSATPTRPTTSTTSPTSTTTLKDGQPAGGQLPQGRRPTRTATRATPTRSTSRHFLVNTINQIEKSKYWRSTAIVITYDDSDGWYDHQVMPSRERRLTHVSGHRDLLLGADHPGQLAPTRCGYGQRLPMLVISPWTRENYVSNNLTDTASVVKFIEDNWLHGRAASARLLRRHLGQPVRARRPARLPHLAALPAGHPQPDHR